jgi:hypothetical protein
LPACDGVRAFISSLMTLRVSTANGFSPFCGSSAIEIWIRTFAASDCLSVSTFGPLNYESGGQRISSRALPP